MRQSWSKQPDDWNKADTSWNQIFFLETHFLKKITESIFRIKYFSIRIVYDPIIDFFFYPSLNKNSSNYGG